MSEQVLRVTQQIEKLYSMIDEGDEVFGDEIENRMSDELPLDVCSKFWSDYFDRVESSDALIGLLTYATLNELESGFSSIIESLN